MSKVKDTKAVPAAAEQPVGVRAKDHDEQLRAGCRVTILKTENTQQRTATECAAIRYPGIIGSLGVILEVPQHPNTWFRVKCDDGETYTLRPSALELVEDDKAAKINT
eukprot:18377-Heterococcus_DN1.PRE.1